MIIKIKFFDLLTLLIKFVNIILITKQEMIIIKNKLIYIFEMLMEI